VTAFVHTPGTSLHLIADIEHAERLDDLAHVEQVLREAAEAALRFGLRLDPWFSEALRLLERLQRPSRP